MTSTARIRRCGSLAMVGGAIWTAAWILNSFTEDGTRAVLGLSERGWRRTLDPALLFFMAGLVGLHARHQRHSGKLLKAGFIITFVSLATMLAGNVLEWWVRDLIYDRGPEYSRLGGLGWMIFGSGFFMIQPVGLVLFGIAILRAGELSRWRRTLPLALGSMWVLFILVGIIIMLLSITREGLLATWFFSSGAGWVGMGYALWSERADHSAA